MIQDSSEGRIRFEQPVTGFSSLRTRLIVANILITALAIGAMGYYVFFRSQQSSAYLTNQLDANIQQQAHDRLTVASDEQVATLNTFFAGMDKDVTNSGTTAANLLSQEMELNMLSYWDATQSLARLPNGSWYNFAATDAASVFIPAKMQLTDALAEELDALKHLDFLAPAVLRGNPDAVAMYFGGASSGETLYYPNINLASLVPPDFDVTQRPWFVKAAPGENPARATVWSDPYVDAARHGLVVTTSVPVYDSAGTFRGVIAMDIQLNRIADIIGNIRLGDTGYAFLIDRDRRLIAMPPAGYADLSTTADAFPLGAMLEPSKLGGGALEKLDPILTGMSRGHSGLETVSIGGLDRFVIYRPVSEVGYSLAIVVPARELLAGTLKAKEQLEAASTDTTQISFVLVLVILLFAVLATLALGNTLTFPLVTLTQTAEEIIGGNLNAHTNIQTRDEIGILARTLNSMTGSLRGLIESLENRVRDRTAALEVASRTANTRASQFEAITQVTRAISSIRNVDELMPLVTAVISSRFGYYHVGIFLNDETGRYAYLIAANSDGGRRMLERRHRLAIGEQGMVGHVAGAGEARVARVVDEDSVFFDNPDLPDTKSEAALPLRSSGGIIGVLDVQSTGEDAFSPEVIDILAVLADQVSLAIENTRLFERTQRSLLEAETLYRQYVRGAWDRLSRDEAFLGYQYTSLGVEPLNRTQASQDEGVGSGAPGHGAALTVPIELRGEIIADLVVEPALEGGLSAEQIELVQAVAERVALSAENARLFDETMRRAERERLVTQITSRIRSSNDPGEMIETALEELKAALRTSQIQIIPQTISSALDRNPSSYTTPPDANLRRASGNGATK